MNMSTPFVIETHALSKTYKNVQALKSLNLKWTGEEGSYEFTATGTGKQREEGDQMDHRLCVATNQIQTAEKGSQYAK